MASRWHEVDGAMLPTGYLMDDPRESARLAGKVDARDWASRYCVSVLRQYPTSAYVLDVGCGPGVLASAVARCCPEATVCAIDRSADRIGAASNQHSPVHLVQGDARSLAFPDEMFDFVYSRFLLEYLPDRDAAVKEMVRVCKHGGTVLLQDLDGQLLWHYPEDFELQALIHQVVEGLQTTGFDPFVGRKLYSFAKNAGLDVVDLRVEGYHIVAGRIDDRDCAHWDIKLDIALPAIAAIVGSARVARDLKHRFIAYLQRNDTLTYSVMFTCVGRKPGSRKPGRRVPQE